MPSISPSKRIVSFVMATYGLSWGLGYFAFFHGGTAGEILGCFLPFIPGLVGIFLQWKLSHKISDLGFKNCTLKMAALGFAVPTLAVGLSVTALLALRIDVFVSHFPSLVQNFSGLALLFLCAVGEEIGWRGFLHETLNSISKLSRWILTGVIWSVWHFPAILSGVYASSNYPALSAFIFLLDLTAFSIFLGWLRDRSRSLLPVIIAHAVHNFWILEFYPKLLITGPQHPYFGTESGLALTAIYGILALWVLISWE